MTERGEMEAAIEAILFVASEPVPRTRLVELFDEDEREQAAAALAAVLERYTGGEARGVMVEDVAGGVRLVTRPEMGVWLRRFFEVASGSKLSMAALETLAIVAYRQPITGPEIQELRSVNPVGVLKTLLEKRLVRISGRKEVVGKPFLYATTREFLVHFGLNSLRDLPPLEEFEETFGAALPAVLPAVLPAAPAAPAAGSSPMASTSLESPATPAIDPEAGDGGLLEDEEDDAEERFLREAAELDERGEPADSEDREGGEAAGEAKGIARAQPAADWEPPEDDQEAVGEEETAAAAATEVER
ncbi:MAG TPA: SMC-Scp complex subunit ScpB [Thermoanaerobaculia bacterium]|nr:SMC-Scp complex subunit ScpB [Thermoanaerobaculia bacterium]